MLTIQNVSLDYFLTVSTSFGLKTYNTASDWNAAGYPTDLVSEEEEQSSVTASSLVSSSGSGIGLALSIVWSILISNPLIQLFVGACVVALGIEFYKKSQNAVK